MIIFANYNGIHFVFFCDFNNIVTGAITEAGKEFGVSGDALTTLIKNSLAGIKGVNYAKCFEEDTPEMFLRAAKYA